MVSESPAISVILPTYERANILSRAIDSVLNQTYKDFELIIIDDASTDHTENIVNGYSDDRIRYIRHGSNQNASAARNTGIKISEGDYIALLDDDDEWKENKLQSQLAHLESVDGYIACYCDYRNRRQSSIVSQFDYIFLRSSSKQGGTDLIEDILTLSFDHGGSSTLFIESKAVKNIYGFDERFDRHQDIEFLIRLLQDGKLSYLDEELVIKHDSGSPSVDEVITAKKRLLNEFSGLISEYDINEREVRISHQLDLAKIYLKNGDVREGIKTLPLTRRMTTRDVLSILFSLSRAVEVDRKS